jgi:hypothetical protein
MNESKASNISYPFHLAIWQQYVVVHVRNRTPNGRNQNMQCLCISDVHDDFGFSLHHFSQACTAPLFAGMHSMTISKWLEQRDLVGAHTHENRYPTSRRHHPCLIPCKISLEESPTASSHKRPSHRTASPAESPEAA